MTTILRRSFSSILVAISIVSIFGGPVSVKANELATNAEPDPPSPAANPAAASTTGPSSNAEPPVDPETRQLAELLKKVGHNSRLPLWKQVRANTQPEKFSARIVSLSLSEEPILRESALDFLWSSGDDGQLAAAICCAIRYRFTVPHLVWLVSRIDPSYTLAPCYMGLLSAHDNPQVLGEVGQALQRVHVDHQAIVEKLTAILEQGKDLDVRLQAVAALQKIAQNDRELSHCLAEIHRDLQSQKTEQDFNSSIETLRSFISDQAKLRKKTRQEVVRFVKDP